MAVRHSGLIRAGLRTPLGLFRFRSQVGSSAGSVIQTQQAIRLDNDGVAQNQFTLLPGSTTPAETKWST
jgi:hypothetical protein